MWITVATPSFSSIDQVDAVIAQLDGARRAWRLATSGPPATAPSAVVSLWQSQAHAERFLTEKLGPAVAKALGPEPEGAADLLGIDIQRACVAQPVG